MTWRRVTSTHRAGRPQRLPLARATAGTSALIGKRKFGVRDFRGLRSRQRAHAQEAIVAKGQVKQNKANKPKLSTKEKQKKKKEKEAKK